MNAENDAYHSDVARVSNSMLSLLKQSPRLFYNRYELGQTQKATKAMELGSLLHTMVLEPHEVIERFAVMPDVDRRYKEGKAIAAAFCEQSKGKTVIASDDFANSAIMATQVRAHPEFAWALGKVHNKRIEQRIEFEFDGMLCRCKPDMIVPDVIFDVKTTEDASPNEFMRSVLKFGYHRQAAFYREAVLQDTGMFCRFIFVAVSKSEPWDCAVYELDDAAMRAGMNEISMLMEEYRNRKFANDWDQVWSRGVVPLQLPKWYRSNIYEVSEMV